MFLEPNSMTSADAILGPVSIPSAESKKAEARARPGWLAEFCGLTGLAGLLAYFLSVSWRKWPDPLVDSSQQWYAAWRIAQGGRLFKEGRWNYGPLSAYFNGELFRVFGANLTVLFTANLVIYGAILALAYAAFRRAWGKLGAFAACAVFITVFSFSHLTSIGNYNYASPYSHESTHGMLVTFVGLFIAAAWCRKQSRWLSFALGTCGGLTAVMKPEFMLAITAIGMGALVLRLAQRKTVWDSEWVLLVAGALWPTAAFTLVFLPVEPFTKAFPHACNAWWRVVVKKISAPGFAEGQAMMAGFDHPWHNGWTQFQAGIYALVVIAAIWSVGWFINRPTSKGRIAAVLIIGGVAACTNPVGGWFHVGRCLPLLILAIAGLTLGRLVRAYCKPGDLPPAVIMQCLLVLFAITMLARMALFSRIYHFGFFQAPLAAMVAAAVMVVDIPRWTGTLRVGRGAALSCFLLILSLGCVSIAAKSNSIRAEQTQPIGEGLDRFYAFNREVDTTGTLMNWAVKRLGAEPPGTVLVVPDGLAINFLSQRISTTPEIGASWPAERQIMHLNTNAPDYVVEISLDLKERGVQHYGLPNNVGYILVEWIKQNYESVAAWGEPFSGTDLKGARILRRKRH
jgi:hypothetical protein